jgi:signal transduction histidine kinase
MQRIAYWVNVVAVGVGAAVLTSILGFAAATRAFLIRPVRALSDTIQRFGSGDMSMRADEAAPRELRDVARTFNQMASTIARQRENELTSLAGVAHDLNNPIAVLRMLTEPQVVERALASEERLRRTLALVHRQAQRIHRMVRDLFDAVRLEAGELQLELGEHDLREVAAASVELYRDVSELHEVRLSITAVPVLARCDPGRIEQALQNIIANAIKYSPQGGPVSVSVAIEGDRATLLVSDEGIGLSEEQRARIFDAFQRFGPPGISGAGLGLSLVKRIVQAHGGSVEVDSVQGAGSTFRLRLPLAHPVAPPAAGEPIATRDRGPA